MRALLYSYLTTAVVFATWFVGIAGASTLVVDPSGGGTFTDLQAAINFSSPNDVIVVKGGIYEAVEVHTPLTIIGDPMAEIRMQSVGGSPSPLCAHGHQCAALRLTGPGSGTVSLVNLKIGGNWFANVLGYVESAIEGGGFAKLNLYDCEVVGPIPTNSDGTGDGAPSIDTTVPLIRIVGSTVSGASNTADLCETAIQLHKGPIGINAPGSTIVLLDSKVIGGAGSDIFGCFSPICSCPPIPPTPCPCPQLGGEGGTGIVAYAVYTSNSIVLGGAGMEVKDLTTPPGIPWGKQLDGAPFDVQTLVEIPNNLTDSGPMHLGQAWSLLVGTPSPTNFLVFGSPTGPSAIGGIPGSIFLDASSLLVVSIPNTSTVPATVPPVPGLIGVEVGFQVVDPVTGWTRPVTEIITP